MPRDSLNTEFVSCLFKMVLSLSPCNHFDLMYSKARAEDVNFWSAKEPASEGDSMDAERYLRASRLRVGLGVVG